MANLKERTQESLATLGDVLYAKSKNPVTEEDWALLVQSIAAGDQLALHALYESAHRIVFTLIMRITPTGKRLKSSPSMSFTPSPASCGLQEPDASGTLSSYSH